VTNAGKSAPLRATSIAHPNIALAKYWGKQTFGHNLPAVPSVSVTLEGMATRTTVEFDRGLARDELVLGGEAAPEGARVRAAGMLDRVRARAGGELGFARVTSANDFPTSSGLASSASAFAALACAALAAAGVEADAAEVSDLARKTSVSAARSAFGGYVELPLGREGDERLPARPIAPGSVLPLVVLVGVVTERAKDVPSTEGMAHTVRTSPYYPAWVASSPALAARVSRAILAGDFSALGVAAEESALLMHASALGATPGILYFQPATVALIGAVRAMRARGLEAYFTIDAGPHVKVLARPDEAERVAAELAAAPGVLRVLRARAGEGARVVASPDPS